MWYSSPSKKNKLIYQVRANTYVFWLSGQYGKFNSNIFLFHPLGPFPSKNMRCPWILCFDLLLLQYTDLTHEIWRFLVYIFLGGPKIYSIFFLKICIEIWSKVRIDYMENKSMKKLSSAGAGQKPKSPDWNSEFRI